MDEKHYFYVGGALGGFTKTEIKHMLLKTGSGAEWDAIVDALKKSCGGYPDWWYGTIIKNDVLLRATANWKYE